MYFYIFNIITSAFIYVLFYYLKTGSFSFNYIYTILFIYFLIISSFISFYYEPKNYSFRRRSKESILEFLFILFILSLIVSLTSLIDISRLFLLQVVFANSFFRWLIGFYFQRNIPEVPKKAQQNKFSKKRAFISFAILFISMIISYNYKFGFSVEYQWIEQYALIFIVIWWLTSLITKKFYVRNTQNLFYKITPFIKSQSLFIISISILLFWFRFDYLSRQLLFVAAGLFSIFETFFFIILFSRKETQITKVNEYKSFEQSLLKISKSERRRLPNEYLLEKLKIIKNKQVSRFVLDCITNYNINLSKNSLTVVETSNPNNFMMQDASQNCIVNFELVNNFRYINNMFLYMNLKPGGYYFGSFSPLEEDYMYLRDRMPRFLFTLLYPFHFAIYRVFQNPNNWSFL